MAQLRQDYSEFVVRNAEILVMGPDGPNAFRRYWQNEQIPFIGLADLKNQIADLYNQEVNWLKLGRMPAIVVVDKEGNIRYRHYGRSMADIPENQVLFKILDEIK
jgi:peroxiredoxin